MLQLNPHPTGWDVPVVKTVATSGQGIEDVLAAIDAHRRYLSADGSLESRRKARRREEILRIVDARTRMRARELAHRSGRLDQLADRVYAGEIDPYTAAEELLKQA
jgi:LAO/AO transport system kinase